MTNTPKPSYSYDVEPRPAHLGGGWRARFLEDGTEVGGGVFSADADADPQAGIDWWNGLTEDERRVWLAHADSAKPRDAWQAYLEQDAYDEAQSAAMSWLDSRERQ